MWFKFIIIIKQTTKYLNKSTLFNRLLLNIKIKIDWWLTSVMILELNIV